MPFHIFDVDLAAEFGILEAVLLYNIYFWISKNKANGQGFHDGRFWTYNSTKAFAVLFPYASKKQIERALSHLRELGVLIVGNYNSDLRDRTLWYSLSEKGECLFQKKETEIPKTGNGYPEIGKCINNNIKNIYSTDINADINTDINEFRAEAQKPRASTEKRFIPPEVAEVQAYCSERKNGIDAHRFVDYYASKGWMIGKNKMKDWRAAVRTWERSEGRKIVPPEERPTDLDDLF